MNSHSKQVSVAKWSRLVTLHPGKALLVILGLTIGLGFGAQFMQNTLDYHFFFSKENPQLAAYEQFQDAYERSEAVFIAVQTKQGDVFDPKVLSVLEEITEASWQVPYNLRVDSLTNFQYTRSTEEGLAVDDLFRDSLNMTEDDLAKRKNFALSEPALVNSLVSKDAKVAGFHLSIQVPGLDREKETPEVVGFVRKIASDFEAKYPYLKFYMAGQVIVDQAFPESTNADFGFVWPAFFIVMVVLLTIIFRSGWFTLAALLVGATAIVSGMGLMGWFHLKVNAAVTAAPVIIMTLAMADSIHILASYEQYLKRGLSKAEAMVASLEHNFMAILLTSFMTGLGFLTLHFNDSPPYRALGYVVTAGVFFAWLYSVVLLPALLMLIPHKVPAMAKKDDKESANKENANMIQGGGSLLLGRLGDLVVHNRAMLFVVVAAISMVLVLANKQNVLNDDPAKYFGETQTMRQHMEFINTRITGLGTLNYSIGSGVENGVVDLAYLQKVEQFSKWLKAQPNVVQVDSIVDIIKRVNKSWHNDDPEYYRLPENREQAAQLLLVYELSLPVGMDVNNMITLNKEASRVRVVMDDTSGNYHVSLDEQAKSWLDSELSGDQTYLSASSTLMFAHIGKRSIQGILVGLIGSLFVIAVLLTVLFRSWQLGVISIVSNVLPIALAFGAWALIDGNVDLGLTVTLAIAFGIVVDDTIHFLSKYRNARIHLNLNTESAVSYAFSTVGIAIIVTTIVLVAGFAMLGFSAMNITANMAILTTMTILFALVIDFFLVPVLLLWFDRDQPSAK